MKTSVSLSVLALALALGTAPAYAQSNPSTDPPDARPGTPPAITGSTATPATRAATASDQRFLDEAHASGQKEIHAAQLAKDRTSDKDVRELAELIERDHRALNDKLQAAGAKASADQAGAAHRGRMPAETAGPATSDTAIVGESGNPGRDDGAPGTGDAQAGSAETLAKDTHMKGLLSVQGEAFDVAYLDMLVQMHQKSIAKFQAVADGEGHSQPVKALAREALPALRRHASMASSLKEVIEKE